MNTTTDEVIELTAGDSWVLLNSINILLMQAGFSLLEAGTVDKKHGKSVLMKNLMDGCFGAIVWYFCGYGIYTGDNSFGAGTGAVFLPNQAADFKDFFVSYAFAITGATIVSGAVVGRIQLKYYLLCSFLITGLVYPLIAHWVWNSSGFLNPYYVDFAGGVCVHGMGGLVALVGAYYSGPRIGRFGARAQAADGTRCKDGVVEMRPSNPGMQSLGTLILFASWFSFNGVSAGTDLDMATRACVNTLLSSASAACVGLMYTKQTTGYYDLSVSMNSLLAGLVGVTQSAGYVDTWAALLIGVFSILVFFSCEYLILYTLRIDDPLSASALHGGAGIFGAVACGVFHRERGLITGETALFVAQLWGTTLIAVFCLAFSFLFFHTCQIYGGGTVSVPEEDQILGLDFKYHDGYVIDDLNARQVREFNQKKIALKKVISKRSGHNSSVAPASASEISKVDT